MARTPGLSANLNAFLDMIAISELTAAVLAQSDDGYNVEVGSTPGHVQTFPSYAAHPGLVVQVTPTLVSTAAGRYQVLKRYADAYVAQLKLPDFGPESQDAIAIQMLRECGALTYIEEGRVYTALGLCSSRWASLPGSGYGQPTNPVDDLVDVFRAAGGQPTAPDPADGFGVSPV